MATVALQVGYVTTSYRNSTSKLIKETITSNVPL